MLVFVCLFEQNFNFQIPKRALLDVSHQNFEFLRDSIVNVKSSNFDSTVEPIRLDIISAFGQNTYSRIIMANELVQKSSTCVNNLLKFLEANQDECEKFRKS